MLKLGSLLISGAAALRPDSSSEKQILGSSDTGKTIFKAAEDNTDTAKKERRAAQSKIARDARAAKRNPA